MAYTVAECTKQHPSQNLCDEMSEAMADFDAEAESANLPSEDVELARECLRCEFGPPKFASSSPFRYQPSDEPSVGAVRCDLASFSRTAGHAALSSLSNEVGDR